MIHTGLTVRAIAASAIISLGLAVQAQAYLLVAAKANANPPLGAAYYMATNGSDSNDGLAPATGNGHGPFLTIGKCQTAMQSSTIKTCFIRAGTYTLSAVWNPGAGQTYWGYPGDPANSATIATNGGNNFNCAASGNCAANIIIGNLTITGGTGNIIYFANANGLQILQNVITNTSCSSNNVTIQGYNSDNVYIQGNTINGCAYGTGMASDTIGYAGNDSNTHTTMIVSDNTISGCARWCVEIWSNSGVSVMNNDHIDRNTMTNWDGTPSSGNTCGTLAAGGGGAVSQVAQTTTPSVTFWGNTITANAADKTCSWGVETSSNNASIEHNIFTNVGQVFVISHASGTEIENNTITLLTSGLPCQSFQPNCAGVSESQDGGYQGNEWVGNNTVNGVVTNGCLNSTGTGPVTYCGPKPFGNWPTAFGSQPTVTQPSPTYQPTSYPPGFTS